MILILNVARKLQTRLQHIHSTSINVKNSTKKGLNYEVKLCMATLATSMLSFHITPPDTTEFKDKTRNGPINGDLL